MEIQAAVLHEPHGSFQIERVSLDEPRADEVVVKLAGTGVCHTDLIALEGAFPLGNGMVLGHEGAGVVQAIGASVRNVDVGDRVMLSYASCGHCRRCMRGIPQYCGSFGQLNAGGSRPDGSPTLRLDGKPLVGHWFGQSSFASHALTYERNLVKVTDPSLPLELLGPMGCGIQTGAGAVLNTAGAEAGRSIVVFGCGGVGLAAVMAANVAGCAPIVAIDLHAHRRQLAGELGATITIDPREADGAVSSVQAALGELADYAIDTTAVAARQAVDCIGPGGVAVLIGVGMGELTLDGEQMLYGRTVKGTIEGDAVPQDFLPRLLQLHTQGRFPFDRLVSTYPLEDINTAVADTLSGKTVKPILVASS